MRQALQLRLGALQLAVTLSQLALLAVDLRDEQAEQAAAGQGEPEQRRVEQACDLVVLLALDIHVPKGHGHANTGQGNAHRQQAAEGPSQRAGGLFLFVGHRGIGRGHKPAGGSDCPCIGAVPAKLSQTGVFLAQGACSKLKRFTRPDT